MTNPISQSAQACVFDAYGTLFDVHSAVNKHRDRLDSLADPVSALWRAKQLEYTWLRSLMDRHTDFWQVTQDALDFAFDSFAVRDDRLRNKLMEAYLELDCYPEVPVVLQWLKELGYRTAILSNGSPAMLQAAVDSARLGEWIDMILSVEEVGVYKPHPRVYQLAVDKLGISSVNINFLSSNAWDVAGAASFGFRVIWINRFSRKREQLPYGPHAELTTLNELPTLLEQRL